MSISKLASGRYGAQVHDPRTRGNVRISRILPKDYTSSAGAVGNQSFRTKAEAKAAREDARKLVAKAVELGLAAGTFAASADATAARVTIAEFNERWLTDPIFHGRWRDGAAGPNAKHNRERTKEFVKVYGAVAIEDFDDELSAEWLAGGRRAGGRNGTVSALRAMFNAARRPKAGRLVTVNPFADLGLDRRTGNRYKQPADEDMVWKLVTAARTLAGPYFAAWLQFAAFTGMRPGEVDALERETRYDHDLELHSSYVDFVKGEIHVNRQWNTTVGRWTLPKNGRTRIAVLTPPARAALLPLAADGPFWFVNTHGDHFTTSSRAYHWKAIKASAGWQKSLYLATRHFAGGYMTNVLNIDSEDVGIALGHTDGGELVRRLYGHRDVGLALDRVAAAYERSNNVTPLRVIEGESA